MIVDDVMTTSVATVREDDALSDALERFRIGGLRHVVVVDGDGRFAGLLNDRLAVEYFGHDPRALRCTRVRDTVFDRRTSVAVGTPVVVATKEILRHSAGALAVVDENLAVVGVITGADLLRSFAKEIEREPSDT